MVLGLAKDTTLATNLPDANHLYKQRTSPLAFLLVSTLHFRDLARFPPAIKAAFIAPQAPLPNDKSSLLGRPLQIRPETAARSAALCGLPYGKCKLNGLRHGHSACLPCSTSNLAEGH